MNFFFSLFEKDREFFKSLSNRKRKLLIYFLIFFLFFLILFVEKERFIIFFILLSILLIWKILIEIFFYIIIDNDKLEVFIIKNNDKFNYLIKILLFIQKWKNPILVFLLYLDKFILKITRNFVYNIRIKYNYQLTVNQIYKLFMFYYFIINLLFGPLKLFFGFIYLIMCRIINFPFSLFFIIRIMSFIISILIFSNVFNYLYNQLGIYNLCIFIYFFLVLINCIIKYIDRDFEYFKIQYITSFINTDYLIYLRNHSTFIGILILSISCYNLSSIEKKYIDILSSYSKIHLEEGFYKYWDFYKKNTWFNTMNIWYDIKNRPSFFLYSNLMVWMNLSLRNIQYVPNHITNIIYIKFRADYLKINLSDNLLKDLDFLYKFFLLRLKLLLFIIWDIESYIGNRNVNSIICAYDIRLKIYNIQSDLKSFDFLDYENFTIEKNVEDLPFYNLEENIEFFDLLYMLVGIIPYNENPLELRVFSGFLKNISDLMDDVDKRLELQARLNNLSSWNRGWHFYIKFEEEKDKLLIENKVKEWIETFLKETREEWSLLVEVEGLEERNYRLLDEIEELLIKRYANF